MFRYGSKNYKVGKIREVRARSYMEKIFGWNVEKTNLIIDQYHSIDFLAQNKKGEKIMVQVKGFSMRKKKPDEKAINFAIKNNAILYYCYVPNSRSSIPVFKKIFLQKGE